jgi:hypothetical protein
MLRAIMIHSNTVFSIIFLRWVSSTLSTFLFAVSYVQVAPIPCGDFARPKESENLVATWPRKRVASSASLSGSTCLCISRRNCHMGEATFLPSLGKFHYAAKLDENGCIDPCLMGRFWKRQNDAFNKALRHKQHHSKNGSSCLGKKCMNEGL